MTNTGTATVIERTSAPTTMGGEMHFLRVAVQGRSYLLSASPHGGYVTVLTGRINRRSIGKTFWSRADLVAHYKRDGEALGRLVDEI